MTDLPDTELLEQFTRNQSEDAFAALVERYVGLVHSVALRRTANPQHAQDITQAVFIILARKAGGFGQKRVLAGWLYQTARLTAANFQRADARRIRREQEASMQSTLEEPATDPLWPELAPHLEDAMASLGGSERDALVLRYFQNKSVAEVGRVLGLKENTAQQRLGRALEKLRKFFTKRGVASTTAIIAGAISSNSVQAAPAGLAKTISAVAVAKGAAASTATLTLMKGALKIMAWTKIQTAVATSVAILLVAATATVTLYEVHMHRADVASAPGRARSVKALLIGTEFVEVPNHFLDSLNVPQEPADANAKTAILSESAYTSILAALKQNAEAKVLGKPRIAFVSGLSKTAQGMVSLTQPVKIAGTNAYLGTTLDVSASLSPDSKSVSLDLVAQWNRLADASQGPGTTKAAITATLGLDPGQTLLIQSAVAGNEEADAKTLLVFVTPQLGRVAQRLQSIHRIVRTKSTQPGFPGMPAQ